MLRVKYVAKSDVEVVLMLAASFEVIGLLVKVIEIRCASFAASISSIVMSVRFLA